MTARSAEFTAYLAGLPLAVQLLWERIEASEPRVMLPTSSFVAEIRAHYFSWNTLEACLYLEIDESGAVDWFYCSHRAPGIASYDGDFTRFLGNFLTRGAP